MKSLIQLHTLVAQDMGDMLSIDPTRDIETMVSRVAAEGDSFLTITLPQFESAFLGCIARGRIDLTEFPGFRKRGHLPAFLQGFVGLVFDSDGVLRLDADYEAIRAVRQICCLSKKIERDVQSRRSAQAIEAYAKTDESLPPEESIPEELRRRFARTAERLFGRILDRAEAAVAAYALVPRHGPGAVAEGYSPKAKWDFEQWYESIDSVFPSNMYTSYDVNRGFRTCVAPDQELPVRVITVPKTMKAPRIIAIEPSARQYVQQALSRFLYKELRREYPAELDLLDQETNRAWAWLGSITGEVATLDLSEASDRVSHWLVRLLIGRRPHLLDAIEAARSQLAELPDGRVIGLKKFASMGSALTFPVQSMVFYTLIRMGMQGKNTRHALCGPSVFGDDLIVPNAVSRSVIDYLEVFGLKVNKGKSFVEGNFRESCGREYFKGHDVTIVKLRRDLPRSRSDAQELGSTVAFRNELYRRGMWRTCRALDSHVNRLIRFDPIPEGVDALGRLTFLPVPVERVSPSLQRDEIKRPVLCPKSKVYKVDGESGLLQFFLSKEEGGEDVRPMTHLAGSGSKWDPTERPVAFTINNRWIAV